MANVNINCLSYSAERARVLGWLDMLRDTHKRNSRERQVLDELRGYIESGKQPPQGRML